MHDDGFCGVVGVGVGCLIQIGLAVIGLAVIAVLLGLLFGWEY